MSKGREAMKAKLSGFIKGGKFKKPGMKGKGKC